ncbi:hypothetical protein [Tanticharoenia sakaeratensis]|uniref:Uncharacterized protein n=1 Tax=Tanticharoenia sakaeratensis NBRC 103193 TaxID=1231623 RepID=A0A0D6MNV9_9PROT|nr:hypothetical protein [Tanticharoenia sakaeratensis]GAN54973.1 hypothetical protein Tasa_035_008 [Tanticharoenia sakaeratensis NBRC 103193]GBQ16650.1 hypothetical protein AA103193_0058 [Tanticharoenia sakaeratensis NBRC 103193]
MRIDTAVGSAGSGTEMLGQHEAQTTKTDKNAAYNQDLEQGMDQVEQSDPMLFAKIMTDGHSGNGNQLVEDELQAYKEGDLTKEQAVDAVSGAQSLANDNGGGKINKHVKSDAEAALGGSYIKGGQTRAGHAILKFLEDISPLAQMIKGIKSKTSDGTQKESVLDAGQGALQSGVQQVMSDLSETDPALAQQFAKDAKSKDGNAMAEDLVAAGQESSTLGGSFSDSDAAMLGSQLGSMGKGKISSKDADAFQAEFGQGTIARGSSSASKGWDKFENGLGNFMSSLVSPVTDGVGAIDQFAKGNTSEGLKDLGGAFMGVASDAALIVAPEAAPEMEGAETAARAGEAGATAGAEAAEEGGTSVLQTIQNIASDGYDALDYASNVAGMAENNNGTGGGRLGLL